MNAQHLTEADLWAAVNAMRMRAPAGHPWLRILDAAGPPDLALARTVLGQAVAATADRGWSAADLAHVVTRKLSAGHARLANDGDPGTATPATAVRMAVAALALVAALPALEGTPADHDGQLSGLDPKVLARVRALLRKAESTEFEQEAEALTAKAQELIARHAIDALVLSAADEEGPTSRRIYLDDPYLDAKATLLDGVARANRCSAVYSPSFGWATVFGYPADLDAVELLTGSLLAQAAHALALHGSRVDRYGRSRTKSFRRSFLAGFAHRVGQRLAQATAAQVAATPGADNLLPVLASRDERVAALQADTFPTLRSKVTRVSNAGGWMAGQAAGDAADLSGGAGAVSRRSAGEG